MDSKRYSRLCLFAAPARICATLLLFLMVAASSAQDTVPPVVPPEGEGDVVGYDAVADAVAGEVEDAETDLDSAESAGSASVPEIVRARVRSELGHRLVKDIRHVADGVGRMEWSQQGDWIAYDRPGELGPRQIFLSRLDNDIEKCLTCELYELRKHNLLSPTWHPSGQWLVVLGQARAKRMKMNNLRLASPMRALHSDLWVVARDGRDAWQLTNAVAQGGAIIDPHFSYEGSQLAWTERLDSTVKPWGEWAVHVAPFKDSRGLPRIKSPRTFELPWRAFVQVHGFTPDDRGLWLTVTRDPLAGRPGLVPGRLDLDTGRFELIEGGDGLWDELLTQVPQGDRLVWASDAGLQRRDRGQLQRHHDLWFMSPSGRRKERLTFFNDPQSEHSLGEAWIVDTSWNPDGDRLLVQILKPSKPGADQVGEESLYVVEFSPDLQR